MAIFKNDGAYAEGVCSLIRWQGFGEKTPIGNTRGTPYNDYPPAWDSYKGFLQSIVSSKDWTGSYATKFERNSMVLAVVLSTQPVALGYMRRLGMREIMSEYDKYNHKAHYMMMHPKEMMAAAARQLAELDTDASKDASPAKVPA